MSEPSPLRNVALAANRLAASPSARFIAGIVSAIASVFLAGWWASNVWRDIQDIKDEQVKSHLELARQAELQVKQGEDIAQIKAWLNPNPSKPVISQAYSSKDAHP